MRSTGARAVSVYAPTGWAPDSPPLLVHAGSAAPLPELASIEAAEAFSRFERERQPGGTGTPGAGLRASLATHGYLVPVPLLTSLWSGGSVGGPAADGRAPRRRQSDHPGGPPVAGWIGLQLADDEPGPSADAVPRAVALANALASTIVALYALLTDPLTGLPGRNELYGALREDLSRARRRRLPCSLVLVNPIGLQGVNEQHGRRAGDAVVREVVQSLQALLRRSDVLMRYGGAIFALPVGNVGPEAATLVAERVREHMTGRRFLGDTVHLRWAVGGVSCAPAEDESLDPLDLLQRANEALAGARHRGGDEVVMWRDEARGTASPPTDRLFGIFTGLTDKDYRNMGLLWDVLQALSSAHGTADLAHHVIERLSTLLRLPRAALFLGADSGLRLVYGHTSAGDGASQPLTAGDITEAERATMAAAVGAGEVRRGHVTLRDINHVVLAVPLVTGGRSLGALCLVGRAEALELDRADLHVLGGVAAQVAVAFDRQHLAEQQRVHAEHERRQLQAEVHGLRTALQQTQLVFEGPAMSDLLARTRRVAATDTTVLVTGESGTGKEMLAHTLHQMSARRAKPFVIVDCGAIPATLIDSELFGHERGAFTGAQQRAPGRLAQADGGTVFLDEIGELPLDVQSRLLRFVQEKTISMVGGTRARKVDVRIVAATNRRLEDEVKAGRFREDLFYRLNVVRLHIPPLRDRPEDVRVLAEHFARLAAAEQHKPVVGFTADAERRLASHAWPGNIRELQNTILQAVVLTDGDVLDADDLSLPAPVGAADAVDVRAVEAEPPPPEGAHYSAAWAALRDALAGEVLRLRAATPRVSLPLGRWLAHDIILTAHEQGEGVGVRAAARVGMAQTTFARRLRQAESDRAVTSRPATWTAVRAALAAVMTAPDRPAGDLGAQAETLLLDVVLAHAPTPLAFAAALMGLSAPTMKQRIAERGGALAVAGTAAGQLTSI